MKIFKRCGDFLRPGYHARPLRHLVRDDRGSVAIWVGLSLITFVGCAGLAIDTARGYMVKARLSQALDAAALAGAKSLLSDTRDADIQMLFDANFNAAAFSAEVVGPTINADTTKNTVKVSATATIDTTLMSVLGFTDMTVAAEATAIRAINGLDVVISIDMSLSMEQPASKIDGAINAAKIMVDTLYNDPNPKTVTIGSTTYDLLNIGMVPWNGKVNVRTNSVINGNSYDPSVPGSVQEISVPDGFVNPLADPIDPTASTLTYPKQYVLYKTNISEVLLLSKPEAGWAGGVYARYIDDNIMTNDGDMTLGYGRIGNAADGKDWFGYEPVDPTMGEPQPTSGSASKWTATTGGQEGARVWTNRSKKCKNAYWNDNRADPDRPIFVGNAPYYWKNASGFNDAESSECYPTLKHGILPLQGVKDSASKTIVTTAINNLNSGTSTPDGNTNATQGLFWAWEVLMPGEPFSQARVSVPFKRTQAIVFLTDGRTTGLNGDAYKGVFGEMYDGNTTTSHGTLPDGQPNNHYNRLRALAAKIKGSNPDQGVKIFVVQYEDNDSSLKALLKQVATEPNAPYYFYAPGATELQNAFKQIAASLSVLRLEQ
ncbi:pilus assembly protein TadG-related protein [Dongia sp.]|uniref:pilus assembly protein TadG-related protein n=1 Tax=Dongia sp. TaxID=1977262 RepID=UPI0035B10F23